MNKINKGFQRQSTIFIFLPFAFLLFTCLSFAQTLAPVAPGKDAQWATAGKQGVGTSVSLESKVWFTLAQGVLTEVYYPDVTVANVHLLQFVVVNQKTKKVETERDDANHQIKVLRPDSLTFQQINTAKSGEWKITKTYTTDPDKLAVVMIDVQFEAKDKYLNLYYYYDASIGNSGMHDTAFKQEDKVISYDGKIYSSLLISTGIEDQTNGFYQTSDGLEQLRRNGKISTQYDKAEKGNVVQMAKIKNPQKFTAILSFADNDAGAFVLAVLSKTKGFKKCLEEYEKGWSDYVKTLRKVDPKYQAQFNVAAMILKAHEDKTHRGANIASLTVPWGGGENANEPNIGGYHLVWSRDLYQVATAFMALGDKAAAERALDFLFKVQQKPDGSFPQNSWLDGKPFWNSLQMDEVAYPLIMAYQLGRFDKATYTNHVKRAADFIVKNGPRTPQERWEEESGFSPSTIAAEIAGLICAAEIARRNGDEASALIYTATADDWARKIEMWTATTTGKYGDGNYYLRITGSGNPDKGEKIELNNGAGFFDEREIVDAGFLELVRLGIKPPDDPLIQKSLKVIDQIIKVDTPNGEGFYRYNHDGYGEMDDGRRWNWDGKYTGKGRLWTLLSGERGLYELSLHERLAQKIYGGFQKQSSVYGGKIPESSTKEIFEPMGKAYKRADTMMNFANEGLMIPEQVWDRKETPKADLQFSPDLKFGEATGSATPLAWSMAIFIRLVASLEQRGGFRLNNYSETPDAVYNRYIKNGIPTQVSNFGGIDEEVVLPFKAGETAKVPRQAQPRTKVAYSINGETRLTEADEKGQVVLEFKMPSEDSVGILGIETPDGATAFERVKLLVKPKTQEFSPALIEKIKTAKSSPLIENGKAILFYRGAANRVEVAGDMTNWNSGRIFMQDVAENLKAVQLDFAPTARVEYKLIVDGKWIDDPLNSNGLDNGVGGKNSFFVMPEYESNEFANGEKPPLEEFEIVTRNFGTRKIKVYLPPDYQNSPARFPVLYFQDGSEYFSRAGAANVQRNLVEAKKTKPFIMVFVDPKDRTKEYWASDLWADFMANELVPEIDRRYRTVNKREGRALLGASLGGITSIWIGLKHPDKFARIGGQSSSFWVDNERVVKELSRLDAGKIKYTFYLDDGTLEGAEDTRKVNVMLRGKAFPVTYIEGETGHNWTSWRDRLADAFIALWK